MGGHGHDHEPYKVPHPSVYKIENCPELKQVQEALARQGLCDPWLRNEAWRYDTKVFHTHAYRARVFFGRGVITGLAAFAATIGIEYLLDNGNGHGHGGNGGNGDGGETKE